MVWADRRVAVGEPLLDLDSAAGRVDGAGELYEEAVADGVKFLTAVGRKNGSQNLTMLGEEVNGQGFVLLGQRAVAHHVGEHEGRKLALFAHGRQERRARARGPVTRGPPTGDPTIGRIQR